jgi:hypothetical protein
MACNVWMCPDLGSKPGMLLGSASALDWSMTSSAAMPAVPEEWPHSRFGVDATCAGDPGAVVVHWRASCARNACARASPAPQPEDAGDTASIGSWRPSA